MYTFGKVKVGVYELMWCVSSSGAMGASGAKKENILLWYICWTWLTVIMESHRNTTFNHTHKLSFSLCIHGCKQWHYPFLPPSNQSLYSHQSPWQLWSDWYSYIPGNTTVAAKTKPEDHQKTRGAVKRLSHCSVYLRRKTTTGAIYPWQQGVILRLNVDPRQSGCILIRNENCWYK